MVQVISIIGSITQWFKQYPLLVQLLNGSSNIHYWFNYSMVQAISIIGSITCTQWFKQYYWLNRSVFSLVQTVSVVSRNNVLLIQAISNWQHQFSFGTLTTRTIEIKQTLTKILGKG
jgi:hypothetical protein